MPAFLEVIHTERDECRESVVKVLQNVLAEALDGSVIGVSIAMVRADGAITSRRSQSDDVGRLLGALTLAKHQLLTAIDGQQ